MAEINKKELLELRLTGFPHIQGTIETFSGSNEKEMSNTATPNKIEDSEKSNNENDSRSRGRKRKTNMREALIERTKICPIEHSNSPAEPHARNEFIEFILSDDVSSDELKRRYLDLFDRYRELHEHDNRLSKGLNFCKYWLKEFMIKDCKLRKKQLSETLFENSKRLGQFVTVRVGTEFTEEWQHGSAFKSIEEQIFENNRKKDDLERQKKINARLKNSDRSGFSRSPLERSRRNKSLMLDEVQTSNIVQPSFSLLQNDDFQRLDEAYKLRLALLKKEEADLSNEREKLERERDVHIKSLKRMATEDASKFHDNRELNSRYLLLELIGKGGFSEVYKAFDFFEYKYVAVKIHQLCGDWMDEKKASYIKHAIREYNIHKTLDHPNIVKLLDVFEITNDSFATVMEFCDGNDLDSLLKQVKTINEREAKFVIFQVVSALRYLNERKPPVIHYDLKPANILLLSGLNAWHVKITDFGLSKILPTDHEDTSMDLTTPGAGTYWYLPPECFLRGLQPTKISSKVDVWSVGIIFYQCLYGKKPFGNDLTQARILEQNTILLATTVNFPLKPTVSVDAKNFIKSCLAYSKENRMDVIQMADSLYLKYKRTEKNTMQLIKIEENSR